MKAVCWYGTEDVRVEEVEEPKLLQAGDVIVEVTHAAICGSDLHMYDGYIPFMKKGDILGHEAMGVVREVGSDVATLSVGDRVVVPFPIACGQCWYCKHEMYTLCDNSNPNAQVPETMYGASPAGLYGYSHAFGGFAGGQAEFLRVPFADTGHVKVPDALTDEQVLFLSDILPTGWAGAEWCAIEPGDTVAVWGAGPVGQFAMLAARELGAGKVLAVDLVPERLEMAAAASGAIPVNHHELGLAGVQREIKMHTGGRGPDAVIDAAGMESSDGLLGSYHKVKQTLKLEQDRPVALTEAIMACRKGGHVSVPGVFTGLVDKFPIGALFGKGLTLHGGQVPVQHYATDLLGRIERGEIDPTFVITHRVPLSEAADAYRMFRDEKEHVVKVVVEP